MKANQHLQSFILSREFRTHGIEKNYVEIDETVPNEAASEITLDNASKTSLEAHLGAGIRLAAEKYAQNEEIREFFIKLAKPFIADTPTLEDEA